MNKYEAVIMFYPEVEEEKRNASFDRLKKVIEKDGKINNVDEWKSTESQRLWTQLWDKWL